MSLKNILSKTEEYLQVPSVVGFEGPFMDYLEVDFHRKGYEVLNSGREVVVTKKGLKNPRILTAHIDRHGIVANQEGKFEYAAFNAKHFYQDENKTSEAVFRKSGKRFLDELVYAYDKDGKPLGEGKVKSFSYDFDQKDLLFEIDGLKGLPKGTPVAYKSQLDLQNGNVSSQIDNAISTAVIYQLIQDGFDGRVIFTTQEEIGRSWRHILNYLKDISIDSQEIVTLDTTSYGDERAIQEGLVVLRNKDSNGTFNPKLVASLRDFCEREGIKYEMKDEFIEAQNTKLPKDKHKKLGKTELGHIVDETDGRYNGATVQLPTTNYHTNHETTSALALENYYKALTKILGG